MAEGSNGASPSSSAREARPDSTSEKKWSASGPAAWANASPLHPRSGEPALECRGARSLPNSDLEQLAPVRRPVGTPGLLEVRRRRAIRVCVVRKLDHVVTTLQLPLRPVHSSDATLSGAVVAALTAVRHTAPLFGGPCAARVRRLYAALVPHRFY